MTENNIDIEQLKYIDDEDYLNKYLSSHWKMPVKKFFVVVYFKDIIVLDNSTWIEKFYHPNFGYELTYPVTNLSEKSKSIYLGLDKYGSIKNCDVNSIFLMEVKLSPSYERQKHDNPLQLQVKSVRELESMKKFKLYKDIDGEDLIEKKIVESIVKENSKEIEEGIIAKKEELDDISKTVSETDEKYQTLLNEIENKNNDLEEVMNNILACKQEIAMLEEMRDNMDKEIAAALERKASKLIKLGLLDDDKYNKLIGNEKKYDLEEGTYITFQDLENNPDKLITHIQSYLYNKGIMYDKDLLMDFYALIQTNDFIVLAGDSGTGKTSLVKYFADSVGGYAELYQLNLTGQAQKIY